MGGQYRSGEQAMVGDTVVYSRQTPHSNSPYGKRFQVVGLDEDGDVRFDGFNGGEYASWFALVRRESELAKTIKAVTPLAEPELPVRMTPEVRCACCHVKAPRAVVKDHPTPGNILCESTQVNQPQLQGWLIMVYPFNDWFGKGEQHEGMTLSRFGQRWEEVTKICPKCALQVMGTVKYMQGGGR